MKWLSIVLVIFVAGRVLQVKKTAAIAAVQLFQVV